MKAIGNWGFSQDSLTSLEADAHRDDGKRFVVHADEKLTAFMELEARTGQPLAASTN